MPVQPGHVRREETYRSAVLKGFSDCSVEHRGDGSKAAAGKFPGVVHGSLSLTRQISYCMLSPQLSSLGQILILEMGYDLPVTVQGSPSL